MMAPRIANAAARACDREIMAWLNVNALLVPLRDGDPKDCLDGADNTTRVRDQPLQFRYRTYDVAGGAERLHGRGCPISPGLLAKDGSRFTFPVAEFSD